MGNGGASIHDIQAIRDYHDYLSRFREELSTRSDEIRVQFERITAWVHETAPSYWQQSLRKAQQRFTETRDALAMCRAKVREEDHEACTEQQRQFEKAKRRVAVCEQKIKELKSVQLAWDQFVQVSRPRLAKQSIWLKTTCLGRRQNWTEFCKYCLNIRKVPELFL